MSSFRVGSRFTRCSRAGTDGPHSGRRRAAGPRGPSVSSRKGEPMSARIHRWHFLALTSVGLLLAGLALWGVAAPVPRPQSGLVVHEWGTFLSVQGADGVTL